jgi:mRNA interferase HigB
MFVFGRGRRGNSSYPHEWPQVGVAAGCHQDGDMIRFIMQVIARRTLKEFWARHPHAEGPIRAWLAIVAKANWENPAEIKRQLGNTVDFVGDNRVIFDLGGNKYRLVVHVSFAFGRVLVKFIGTHAAYDRIDPETTSWRKK